MAEHEDATRAKHLRAVIRSRSFAYATAAAAVAALVGAIVSGQALAIGIAPVVAIAVAYGIAFTIADRRAHQDFWAATATALGMTYEGKVDLEAFTPMLAAGDRRSCPEWLTGTLPDGRACGVGNYTFEERHRDSEGRTSWTPYRWTIGLVAVAPPEAAFVRGIYLRPRNALRFFGERTLPRTDKQRLHTESAAFADRYDLYHDPDDDPARLLEVFSPSFIDALCSTELCFDYRAGTLVVFVGDHTEDRTGLVAVLEATKRVVARIDEELAESRAARGPEGVRP